VKSIFYTLSALTLLVVVSILVNIQHQWARSQQNAVIELNREEKIMRTYNNVMEQFAKSLATSVDIQRSPPFVYLTLSFNATLNNTDPDQVHLLHILGNVQRFGELVTLYGKNELSMDYVDLNTLGLENYLVNSSHSLLYHVEPYDYDYEWKFSPALEGEEFIISRPGASNDRVEVYITGPGTNYRAATCCTPTNVTLEFGIKGNATLKWTPQIVLDFSGIDPSEAGVMRVKTVMRMDSRDERIKFHARGAYLNITHGTVSLGGDAVAIG
jgi:hypothetical protein